MPESSPTIAELIQRAIDEGRTTRERLAHRSGRSLGTVNNWITCDWLVPQQDAWPSLCLEIGVTLEEFADAVEATRRVKHRGHLTEAQMALYRRVEELVRSGHSVSAACREVGIRPFAYYRWQNIVDDAHAAGDEAD